MARWRLTAKHYLRSPGIEWEYSESDRNSGRELRKRFEVPLFLDPENPNDWTDRSEQWVIVCYEGKGKSRDITFLGEPTPDMEPLDDEAEEISDSLRHKWVNYGQLSAGQEDYSQSILGKLAEQMDAVLRQATPAPVSMSSVSREEFEELQKQMAALMAQNQVLKERAENAI